MTVHFNFYGADIELRGSIHESMDERFLANDEMEVDLVSGNTIAMRGDPNGNRYVITAFNEYPEHRLARMFAYSIPGLVACVEWMAREYGTQVGCLDGETDDKANGDYATASVSFELVPV